MKLQVVLVLVLATAFAADGVLRAMPVSTVSFRAWEALVANHGPTTPFEPLARYDSGRSSGDLANLGNYQAVRIYRRETFTIDAYGFRNQPGLAESGTVSVLLLGDSFAAGSGNPDALTLAGQLASSFQRPTYSLAPMLPKAASMAAFAGLLRMKPGSWIVHQQTYPYGESLAWAMTPTRHRPTTAIQRFRRTFESDFSPMRVLANRAWKLAQDGVLFANPFSTAVDRRRLQNGDDMLFIAGDTVYDEVPPDALKMIDEAVRYSKSLADEAAAHGLRYLAVLVPIKTAIYGPLTAPPIFTVSRVPGYLARLERDLRAQGLPVVNMFDPFASRARAAAADHQYIYWPDDTHWNPAGIAIAAASIDGAMRDREAAGAPWQ